MQQIPVAAILATEWTLVGIAFFLVVARLYLRLGIQRKALHLSDYLIILAWMSSTALVAMDIFFWKVGWLGQGQEWFAKGGLRSSAALKAIFFDWIPFITAPYCNKAALLSFYFSIFPSSLAHIRWALWAVVAYSVITYIASILLLFLICLPLKEKWFVTENACSIHRQLIFWVVTWVFHLSSDLLIFAIPFPIISRLQLDRRQRIGLFVTFSFGIISIAFCVLRLVDTVVSYPHISTTSLELWCALDCLTGFFAACLPSLRPYLHRRGRESSSEQKKGSFDGRPAGRNVSSNSSLPTLSQPEGYMPDRPSKESRSDEASDWLCNSNIPDSALASYYLKNSRSNGDHV